MSVTCKFLDGADRYERTATGWVDVVEEGLLRLSARLSDHRASVEVVLDVTPSPSFDIVRAAGARRAGDPAGAGEDLADRLSGLAGSRVVSGFRRRVAEALGPDDAWASYVVDAAVESARLSRQVTRLDARQMPQDPTPGDFRRLDLTAWPELVDMCFSYSGTSAPLFAGPGVRVPATRDMYTPRTGTRLVFHRYKRTEITRAGEVLTLYQSMFDQVHGFELWYDVEVGSQRVLRTRALTPRLPYMGICDRPQGRNRMLVGTRLDEGWPALVRETTGGPGGCFQLTDLTGDLFRLLTFA
jgi:Protein of unknown function (DUF2889)